MHESPGRLLFMLLLFLLLMLFLKKIEATSWKVHPLSRISEGV